MSGSELADEIIRRLVYDAGGTDTEPRWDEPLSGGQVPADVLFSVRDLRPILDDVLGRPTPSQETPPDER